MYRNLGGGEFERANLDPCPAGSNNSAAWADFDNDGFLDLFLTVYPAKNWLYRGHGDGTFDQVLTGSLVTDQAASPSGSYQGLWFDYDNDGFLDLYVVNGQDAGTSGAQNFLYHNNGNANAWLNVKLVGTASNRDGAGAKVRVKATFAGQSRWQRRDTSGGDVYNGNQFVAHFGLGNATLVDTVRVEWPSGIVQEVHQVAPRQRLTLTEPARLAMPRLGELEIRCWKGQAFEVQSSSNLSVWTSRGVVTNLTGTLTYTDPDAGKNGCRFYRVTAN